MRFQRGLGILKGPTSTSFLPDECLRHGGRVRSLFQNRNDLPTYGTPLFLAEFGGVGLTTANAAGSFSLDWSSRLPWPRKPWQPLMRRQPSEESTDSDLLRVPPACPRRAGGFPCVRKVFPLLTMSSSHWSLASRTSILLPWCAGRCICALRASASFRASPGVNIVSTLRIVDTTDHRDARRSFPWGHTNS